MNGIRKYGFTLMLLLGLLLLTRFNQKVGWQAVELTWSSIQNMLFLLLPILVLVGLLDQWVHKERLMKYMGQKGGQKGILICLLLGGIAAGPLYVAFPIALLLLEKGASIRYIVFFLGVWTTAKLPVVIYEWTSFGLTFTLLHIGFGLLFYYWLGILFEKMYSPHQILSKNKA
ncbi:permease [Hazenella sp. IB182357]|uniref:Permease n=1 Tax=Polycladospora coralii TaxID=2771432 RepID=A0A926NBE4_9BACL|nr:permease [Polycladospora coralii]MBD1372640.1 permease [Polycladospora coralii]